MAIQTTRGAFNPDSADVAPGNYSRDFRPVEAYNINDGIGLKSAGDLLTLGVKAADEVVKDTIKEDVHANVDPAQDEFTTALQGATKYQAAIRAGTVGSSTNPNDQNMQLPGPQSLLPQSPDTSVPAGLQALPSQLSVLASARGANKISETDYYGRLATIAKDVRSRYPVGYRDYVDSEIQKVTGVDPANAYIRGMVADINAGMSQKDSERTATLGELRNNLKYGPAIKQSYDLFSAGLITAGQALEPLAQAQSQEQSLKLSDLQYTNNAKSREDQQRGALDLSTQIMGNEVSKFQHTIALDPTVKNPDELLRYTQDLASGKIPPNPEQAQQYANMAQSHIVAAQRSIDAELDRVRPEWGGASLRSRSNPTELQTANDAAMKPLIKIRDALSKGDPAAASYYVNALQANQSNARYKMFTDPEFSNYLTMLDSFNHFGGPNAMGALITSSATTKIINEFSKRMDMTKLGLALPNDPSYQKDADNAKDAIRFTQQLMDKNGIANPNAQENIIQMMDGQNGMSLTDPKSTPETKKQIAYSFFGPKNIGIVRSLTPDRPDGRGGTIPGAESFYYRATSKDVQQAVLGQNDPVLNKYYQDFVQTEFQQGVFRPNIAKLDAMNLGTEGSFRVKWDSSNHKVSYEDLSPTTEGTNPYTGRRGIGSNVTGPQQIVNSINKGISGLRNYAESTGRTGDQIDSFIIQNMIDGGMSGKQLSKMEGFTPALAAAIKTSYQKELDAETQAKELKSKRVQDRWSGPSN